MTPSRRDLDLGADGNEIWLSWSFELRCLCGDAGLRYLRTTTFMPQKNAMNPNEPWTNHGWHARPLRPITITRCVTCEALGAGLHWSGLIRVSKMIEKNILFTLSCHGRILHVRSNV